MAPLPIPAFADNYIWRLPAQSGRGTLLVANLQYSGLIFASIYSMLVFGDYLPLMAWLGMAIIVVSAIAAGWLRSGGSKTPLAQD